MGNFAFLFTGQGAQYADMGKDLRGKYSLFKETFGEASEHLKIDLASICSDSEELSKTHNAQAAIFTTSYGIYRLFAEKNIKPVCMAGFSLGEITSFAASEILNFGDALDLIKIRGKVMSEACEYKPGSMYSVIGAPDELVEEVCESVSKKTNGYVIPANYNCPGQVVISGEADAAEKAAGIFSEKKIRTVRLNVAGAFHSGMMRHGQEELTDFLRSINFSPPETTLYSNVTGERFSFGDFKTKDEIKSFMTDYIPRQMSNPVKFRAELENISKSENSCDLFIEAGAGKVLSGFVKRTLGGAKSLSVQDTDSFEAAVVTLSQN